MPAFPFRIALIYVVVSAAWILGSDFVALQFFPDSLAEVQRYKGLAFVGLTAMLLFLLVMQNERRQRRIEAALRVARDQAQAASRAKSVFLAHMSHEIRTPLNAISGFSDVMRMGVFGEIGEPRYREYLDAIHSSSHHLTELLGDLIDLSQLESGDIAITRTSVDLASETKSCVAVWEPMAKQKSLSLTVVLPGKLVLQSSAIRLRQIITNLLANAIRYTETGGVQIVLKAEHWGIVIEIRDTGPGIPEDRLETIRAFIATGSPSTLRPPYDVGGCGLGLVITNRLVQLLGGSLYLESEPNTGTCARVILPTSSGAPVGAV